MVLSWKVTFYYLSFVIACGILWAVIDRLETVWLGPALALQAHFTLIVLEGVGVLSFAIIGLGEIAHRLISPKHKRQTGV